MKLIRELCGQGMSRRSITKARHMSMNSVSEVFDIADERPSAWPDMEAPGDEGGGTAGNSIRTGMYAKASSRDPIGVKSPAK